MKPGDVAAMPADIRHQGFSPKRAMLLVWENATPGLADRYDAGELSPLPDCAVVGRTRFGLYGLGPLHDRRHPVDTAERVTLGNLLGKRL